MGTQEERYEELASTPSGAIIRASGVPEPWPDLTEQQEKIVKERERQAEVAVGTAAQFESAALSGEVRRTL